MGIRSIPIVVALGLQLAGGNAPARAGTVVPAEWVGIWETSSDTFECTTNMFLFSSAGIDTLCPGAVFEDPDLGTVPLDCTSAADAEAFTSHCEGLVELEPGCTATLIFDLTSTRVGDTTTSTSTLNTVYTGECFGSEDTCHRTESTGTRNPDTPPPCEGTANASRTWGALKSLYR